MLKVIKDRNKLQDPKDLKVVFRQKDLLGYKVRQVLTRVKKDLKVLKE